MPISCQICSKEFQKQITNSHLKTHNITTRQYKEQYGKNSLSCPEYKKLMSESRSGTNNPNFGNHWTTEAKDNMSAKKKGIIPWNKGVTYDDTTAHKISASKREEKYAAGILERKSTKPSEETKAKISAGVVSYAKTNPDKMSERARKAIQTKIDNGIDTAFFRNRKHTPHSKKVISDHSKKANQKRSAASSTKHHALANSIKLEIISVSDNVYTLHCLQCGNTFSLTKQYFTDSKFKHDICNICYPNLANRSQKEEAIFKYVQSICPDAVANYRFSPQSKREIDIYIPSKNIGIEFNGLYWHSEQVLRDKLSDYRKYEEVILSVNRLLVIMEDEWDHKPEIVKSRIKHILNKSSNRIFARKCVIKEINSKLASDFCEKYHIQGKGRSNSRFGLFNGSKLIAVMTFSKSNISRKIAEWELNRFCSIPDVSIVGGASKLLKAFELKYNPSSLVTYADRRWSEGNLYDTLGFSFHSITSPGYWYFLPNECVRIHRFSLRKNKNDDPSLTEVENRIKQGYLRIWDCGNKKYIKTY